MLCANSAFNALCSSPSRPACVSRRVLKVGMRSGADTLKRSRKICLQCAKGAFLSHFVGSYFPRLPQCVMTAYFISKRPCMARINNSRSMHPLVNPSATMSRVSVQEMLRRSPLASLSLIAMRCKHYEASLGVQTLDVANASKTLFASTIKSVGG